MSQTLRWFRVHFEDELIRIPANYRSFRLGLN
jgi:hypothetical protein